MLEFVIEKLISLLGPIATLSKEKRELKDNALRSISHALTETHLYYRDLGIGKTRNHDTEAQLVKYWAAAAIPLRHIDEELARTCDTKSEYWINPDMWSSDQIREHGIRLGDLQRSYRKMLTPSFGTARNSKHA